MRIKKESTGLLSGLYFFMLVVGIEVLIRFDSIQGGAADKDNNNIDAHDNYEYRVSDNSERSRTTLS